MGRFPPLSTDSWLLGTSREHEPGGANAGWRNGSEEVALPPAVQPAGPGGHRTVLRREGSARVQQTPRVPRAEGRPRPRLRAAAAEPPRAARWRRSTGFGGGPGSGPAQSRGDPRPARERTRRPRFSRTQAPLADI